MASDAATTPEDGEASVLELVQELASASQADDEASVLDQDMASQDAFYHEMDAPVRSKLERRSTSLLLASQEDGKCGVKMCSTIRKVIERNDDAKATFFQCVFNITNILMGVGLLGLPYSFRSAGYGGGIFCLVLVGFITWRTAILIGREMNGDPRPASYFDGSPFKTPLQPGSSSSTKMMPPLRSFPDIASASFGKYGRLVLSTVLYFELFSCLCIFYIIIGGHLHTLFPSIPAESHITIAAAATVLPAIILGTARRLSYLSMIGTFSTVAVVLVVVFSAIFEGDISSSVSSHHNGRGLVAAYDYEDDDDDEVPFTRMHTFWRTSGLPLGLGMITYCFSGHAIVPSIYTSMKHPHEFESMINMSFTIVILASLAVGFSGYYMFGEAVRDQVTLSLEQNSPAGEPIEILTWLIIITCYSKLVLTMHPLAQGMEEIATPYLPKELFEGLTSAVIKVILIILALFVSICVPSFHFVSALVGMICTVSVSIIFPAAAHLKLFYKKLGIVEKAMDWVFVVFGCIIAVVGTIVTIA